MILNTPLRILLNLKSQKQRYFDINNKKQEQSTSIAQWNCRTQLIVDIYFEILKHKSRNIYVTTDQKYQI